MSLWSKLFGGGGGGGGQARRRPTAEPVDYKGFRITPDPIPEAGGFRIAAIIEKDTGGETLRHHLIRADVCNGVDEASQAALAKAKSLIDEQGETIFD